MSSREFQDYPNEEARSLEEVAAYTHGGRKPVSQTSFPLSLSLSLSLDCVHVCLQFLCV